MLCGAGTEFVQESVCALFWYFSMCFLTFSHSVLCCSCSSGGLSLSRYCSNGVLFAVTVNRVLVTDGVTLQAVSLTDGKVTWEQTLPDGVR